MKAAKPKKPDIDLSVELEFEEYTPQLREYAPQLRPDAKVTPHTFRGSTYYVLQDPVTLQFYRFGEAERFIAVLLDGRTTLKEVHERLVAQHGGRAPSFRDLVHFVLMLRQANLLTPGGGQDAVWAIERATRKRRRQLTQKIANFMYLTIPLLDPERFLSAFLPYVRWAFTKTFFILWMAVVGVGFAAFMYNVNALAQPANSILAPGNLFYLWFGFFIIKTLHEFGHAFAAKNYGAEIHRMGVMFLIFTPCWYVDVTPIWAIPGKWPKVVVGCAGMMTELFLASLAVFAWLALEPGVIRSILYNMIFIAGISTLIFNGNPLLRYDAYYVLADLVEIPNLRQRSSQYMLYLVRRYLFGERTTLMLDSSREKAWFVGYGILSGLYRVFVVVGIILFVASKFFFVGAAMALAMAVVWVLTPLAGAIRYVFFDKAVQSKRARAVGVFFLAAALLGLIVGVVPVSTAVRAPCVLEPAEQSVLRAEWPGFLCEVSVKDGDKVRKGQLLAVAANEDLDLRIQLQELKVTECLARLRRLQTRDVAAAHAEEYRLGMLERDLDVLRRHKASLRFTSPFDGHVIAPELERIKGRFLKLGDEIIRVAPLDKLTVTAVVDTADIASIKGAEGREVRLKFASDPASVYLGKIERVHPSATTTPPAAGLTNTAGGPVLLDPEAREGNRTLLPWYRVDILLDAGQPQLPVGTTGTARFVVGRDPMGKQVYLKFRQMLNRRFLI